MVINERAKGQGPRSIIQSGWTTRRISWLVERGSWSENYHG